MTTLLSDPVSTAVQFSPAGNALKQNQPTAGWEHIRKATMALTWEAAANQLTFGLLAWGLHGNGLTSLPKFMFRELNRSGFQCSLLQIRTRYLASLTPGEAKAAFSQINALLEAEQLRPMIVAYDEVELLPTVDMLAALSARITALLAMANGGRLIVLGITSRPEALSPDLARGFAQFVHLPLPDVTAGEDVLRGIGIPNASVVSRELFNSTLALGMRPTFRGLCDAAHYWQTTAEDSRHATPSEIALALATACNVVADRDYQDYLDRNEVMYTRGKYFIDVWTKVYGTCFPGGVARRLPGIS